MRFAPNAHLPVAVAERLEMPKRNPPHFLPPLQVLIDVVPMSPNQTQFGVEINRVPNSTGTGPEESTVVASTSPGVMLLWVDALGVSR